MGGRVARSIAHAAVQDSLQDAARGTAQGAVHDTTCAARDAACADGFGVATRNTIQKSLVLEAVCSLRNHPTSADVYAAVRKKHPNISRATVYRNLNALATRGEVLRVEVPNGADRFDFNNAPHYHARCRICGGVFDVDMPYQHDLAKRVEDARGFCIERHHILFEGVCAHCAQA